MPAASYSVRPRRLSASSPSAVLMLMTHLQAASGASAICQGNVIFVHSQAPASIVEVEHAGRLVQRAPQALERQLAVRGVDADDIPAGRQRRISHLS